METEKLIDLVYEAPFEPQLWQKVLDHLCDIAGARGGVLHSFPILPNWVMVNEGFSTVPVEGPETLNELFQPLERRLLQMPSRSFQTETDLFPNGEIANVPIFSEYLNRFGVGHSASNLINMPSGPPMMFALLRNSENGPVPAEAVTQLNILRPHLARAVTLSVRNELRQVQNSTQALAAAGLATAALDINGKIIGCNTLFSEMTDHVAIGAGDRFRLTHGPSNAIVIECLTQAAYDNHDNGAKSRSIALPANGDTEPAILHLIPAGNLIQQLFTGIVLFVVIVPLGQQKPASVDLIESLFDLTISEARVAQSLASGEDVKDIAAKYAISPETVRKHLKNIFSKTGFSRQAELSATIAGIRSFE